MSAGWSCSDKAIAHKAAAQARARAEAEVLQLFRTYPVTAVEHLWKLELQIREWRRDRHNVFNIHFERAEEQIAGLLQKGWLKKQEIAALSPARLERINMQTGYEK